MQRGPLRPHPQHRGNRCFLGSPQFLTFGATERRARRPFRDPAPKNSQLAVVIHRGAPQFLTEGPPNPHETAPESSRTPTQDLTNFSPNPHVSAIFSSYYKPLGFMNLNLFEI